MTDLATWGNLPRPDWVEPWSWASNDLGNVGGTVVLDDTQTQQVLTNPFDLMDHWEHGGYPSSLFARSVRDRNYFLDRLIANGMPPLPTASQNRITIESAQFWRTLAVYNGCALDTLFKKLRWDSTSFDHVLSTLLDRGVIYTIGYKPLRSAPRSDLYYFRDTGVLHRLFNPKWSKTGRGRQKFDSSWEGFVIQVLCQSMGREAAASVWRKGDEEIDLLLEWPCARRRWGVEISRSADKHPSEGFWASSRELGLTEEFVIHTGDCDAIKSCRRYTLQKFIEEFTERTSLAGT